MENRIAVSVNDAARMLGVSPWTIRAWVCEGRLRPVRLGRRVLLEPSELQRLVTEAKAKQTEVER